MGGNTNYPTGLDDDASLLDVSDNVTSLIAAHHNNIKEAVKSIERKLGINNSAAATSIEYRLGNPTGGHRHDGASGQGPVVAATAILGLVQGFPVILTVPGSIPSGVNRGIPVSFGRTMQLENIRANLRVGPSAATVVANVKFGASALWGASVGNRIMFAPVGATDFGHASPNITTYPSGAIITVDVDNAIDPDSSRDLSVILVFRG